VSADTDPSYLYRREGMHSRRDGLLTERSVAFAECGGQRHRKPAARVRIPRINLRCTPKGGFYQGDQSVPGEIFTVRLRFPNGYILPPHTHPTDEHVTVLRGTFGVGLGTVFSADGLTLIQPNGFITAPKNMAHFATARGITEVQVHAIGPFQLTYVNPADDPTKK
jgi:quercetin dioxygenase-like cupin family protein